MSDVIITPSELNGVINAPASKSFSHRAIICAALSGGKCNISPLVYSEDVLATIDGIKAIGGKVDTYKNGLVVNGFEHSRSSAFINCRDSGSTLRFLIPICAALGIGAVFKRSLLLSRRPISQYLEILASAEMSFEFNNDLSIGTKGKLKPGKFFIPGNISSQFVSGLLMVLPLLRDDSEIEITCTLESSKYVDMTIEVMEKFGVYVQRTTHGFFIKGNQRYKATDYTIEGDWSQSAFFMVAGAIGGNVTIRGLNRNSPQGDREIFEIIRRFGAKVFWGENELHVKSAPLRGIDIDVSQIPDLVPVIVILAANSKSVTNIVNAERLKFKECDRLDAIYKQMKNLGMDITKSDCGLTINGKSKYSCGTLWSHNDHRIAMALSIMATNLPQKIKIQDSGCVKKSYPHFFEDYNSIGGKADVINMGE